VFLIALELTKKSPFTLRLYPPCILFKIMRTLYEGLPVNNASKRLIDECNSHIQATRNPDNTNNDTTMT
jgi:hypothetical protein